MNLNPFFSKFSALLPKFYYRNIIFILFIFFILFLNLPFNWKSMTIPARNIYRVFAIHLMKFYNYIFKNFIKCSTHMNISIGIWRAVMQYKLFFTFARFSNCFVKIYFFPIIKHFRLSCWKICLH